MYYYLQSKQDGDGCMPLPPRVVTAVPSAIVPTASLLGIESTRHGNSDDKTLGYSIEQFLVVGINQDKLQLVLVLQSQCPNCTYRRCTITRDGVPRNGLSTALQDNPARADAYALTMCSRHAYSSKHA